MNRIINRILGTEIGTPIERTYGITPRYFIGTAIGAGLGVASSIIGGINSAKEANRAQRALEEQNARNEAWYARRYNEDYLDTSAGQNLIRKATDFANENWKKTQGSSAVGGATESASALAKEQGNKVVANTMGDIAAQDTARKSNADAIHMQNQNKYAEQQSSISNQRASNISAVAGATGDALIKAGSAYDGFDSGTTAMNVGNSVKKGS